MAYNLTPKQKKLLKTIVDLIQEEKIDDEFYIKWDGNEATGDSATFYNHKLPKSFPPRAITHAGIDALVADGLLSYHGSSPDPLCAITGRAFKAVESDFAESDTEATVINDFSGSQFAGGFAATVQGNQVGGSINNQASEIPSLAEVATEIRSLLETIKVSAPNAIEAVRRLTELNLGLIERLEKIEAVRERDRILELQQARLVPKAQWGQNRKYILNLENQGKATAEMVHIKADGVSVGKVTQICAGGCRSYDLGTSCYQSKDAKEIHVEWTDLTGQRTLEINLEWIS